MKIRRRAFIKVLGSGLSSLSLAAMQRSLAAAIGTVAAVLGTSTARADSSTQLAQTGKLLVLKTHATTFRINAKGSFSAIEASGEHNYLARGEPAPVLSLRVAGKLHPPARATWLGARNILTLHYDDIGATATLAISEKPTHLTLELTHISTPVELVLWGPYPTIIGDLIGEVVGIVRDSNFAIGIQALNAKTLGGYPSQESTLR